MTSELLTLAVVVGVDVLGFLRAVVIHVRLGGARAIEVVGAHFALFTGEFQPLPAAAAGEEALYKWIGSVLEAADKNPEIKKTLTETAVASERELIDPFFQWRNSCASRLDRASRY